MKKTKIISVVLLIISVLMFSMGLKLQEKAYEINDEIYDKDELCKRLGNHDVNNMNVENFPSVLLLYSTTDTVVNYKVNALCFYKLLKDNNKLVEAIQIDENGEVKEHGDIAHFNPKKCVEWFNNH